MVPFLQDQLAVFGGYGIPTGPTLPGTIFTENTKQTDGRGWSSELHLFNITEGMWPLHYLQDERYPVDFNVKYADKNVLIHLPQASGPPLPQLALGHLPVPSSPSLPLATTK